jgi:hypothetical protein
LWLSDGDLIIRAENFSFRIYSKALAANSTVFADMLGFSPLVGDAADNEMMDGLPVVHLFDSAADATLFLKAIFDAMCVLISLRNYELMSLTHLCLQFFSGPRHH